MTAPMQIDYHNILRVWQEADAIEEIEHAWLFDHLMPIGGDPDGPAYEGWTLLPALAAQTRRLRLGVLVTSNRFRPPAMLAKIAATVDVVSGGRLDFGIGAGSRPDHPLARREYEAHGLPFHDFAHSVGSLAEACTIIRRLWTETGPFDFDGTYVQLTGRSATPSRSSALPADPDRRTLVCDATRGCRARRLVEHPRRRHRRRRPPQCAAGPLLRRDRSRPRLDHPLDPPAGLLRPAREHPGRDRQGGRRRLPAHRPRTAGAYPANVARWVTDELVTTSA
jgi:Coenzyme F420-dependent N5,N10-methylene tetrahydromethanopterin reductase and related flavin-dependent oxidoreductases